MANTVKTGEVTMKGLATAFEGKHVNISPMDHYGISIEMYKATIEFEEDLGHELYFVSRDDEDKVTGSICIDEDSIESIEQYGDTYTINFTHNMTGFDISEYKTLEELQKERVEKQKA